MQITIPTMVSVTSSNIEAIGYALDERTLHVKFKSGAHHCYEGVDAETATEAQSADSPGGYFAKHIKGKYPSWKLAPEAAS